MSQETVRKESFEFVEQDTDGLLNLEPPPPHFFECTKVEGARVHHVLVLSTRDQVGKSRKIGIVTDYQNLLSLGRRIVRTLDPSPQDQALDELKVIRKLMEDQK